MRRFKLAGLTAVLLLTTSYALAVEVVVSRPVNKPTPPFTNKSFVMVIVTLNVMDDDD